MYVGEGLAVGLGVKAQVVVVHGHGQGAFGLFLADYVFIQKGFYGYRVLIRVWTAVALRPQLLTTW